MFLLSVPLCPSFLLLPFPALALTLQLRLARNFQQSFCLSPECWNYLCTAVLVWVCSFGVSLPSFLLPCSHVIFLWLPLALLIQSVHSYQSILPTGPLPRVSFLLTKLWLLSLSCILTPDSVPKAAHQSLCTLVSPLPFAPGSSRSFSSTCPLSWCCSGKCIF